MEYVKMGLLRNALIKFIHDARFTNRLKKVQSASLFINVLFSVIVIIFFLFCSDWLSQLLKTQALSQLLKWSMILVIFQIPFNHCEIVQQSHMQYKMTFFAYFLRQGLLFLFIVVTAFWSVNFLTVLHLVWAQTGAMILSSTYFLIASRKYISSKFYFDKEIVSKLLQFGKYVFGTAALSHVYKFADHFVTAFAIGNPIAGKIYVSYYSVVARISNVLDVPFMAVADVLFPKNAQAMAAGGTEKIKYYFEKMVGTLTALIIPASLFIFFVPGLIIKIVAGPAYLEAVPILQVTMLFAFLRPFFSQFGYTMDSIGKPQVNFLVNLFFLILSLLSTFISIYWFGGLMGAVYATTFTSVIGCLIFYFILRSNLNIELINIIRYTFSTYPDLFNFVRKATVRPA